MPNNWSKLSFKIFPVFKLIKRKKSSKFLTLLTDFISIFLHFDLMIVKWVGWQFKIKQFFDSRNTDGMRGTKMADKKEFATKIERET